ncbi:MAG: prenyltransferase [Candidatus Binatia bacterium]
MFDAGLRGAKAATGEGTPTMVMENWIEVIRTAKLSVDKPMDVVSRWLIITRAAVFSMTLTSGLIGGLLAATADTFAWTPFLLALLGLLLAHAANNMINDYFDLTGGVDTPEYYRAQYAPHPILAGLISKPGLRNAIIVVNALDAVIAVYLTTVRGWPVLLFAALGLFISVFYVAPPIRLKHIGLGELGVAIVWGPLMVGGTYYCAAGTMPPWVVAASLPYALAVTTVLVGKHLDKCEQDKARGIRTLPVILGFRTSLRLNQAMMVAFYLVTLALVVTQMLGLWVLLIVFSLPRLRGVLRIYSQAKPAVPPANFPVWPLWYVAAAFHLNKLAGGLFVLGLVLNLILPHRLPF